MLNRELDRLFYLQNRFNLDREENGLHTNFDRAAV